MNTPPPGGLNEDDCAVILFKMRLYNMTGTGWYELVQNYRRWLRSEPQQGYFRDQHEGGRHDFKWIWDTNSPACLLDQHPELRPR